MRIKCRKVAFATCLMVIGLFTIVCDAYSGPPLLSFGNLGLAPVFDLDGVTPLAGSTYMAHVFAGPPGTPESALQQVGRGEPFYSDYRAGHWYGSVIDVSGYTDMNRTFVVQVRVYPSASASFDSAKAAGMPYGVSQLFTLMDVGGTQPAPDLLGLQSFKLVPEPSTLGLACIGTSLFALRRWRYAKRLKSKS